jgi:tetraacyldisaccharide 4'-kinase
VTVASDGRRVLEETPRTGDEPQMLARALPGVPVLVASDRYLAGRLAERRFGATVTLLDDGFQHLALARTIDLLLVDPQDLDERVLPSGRLREPLSAARSADAVLVHGSAAEAERVAGALGVGTAFTVRRCYGVLRAIRPAGGPPGVRRNGTRVLAAAGIARPERFFAALRDQGFTVAREVAFRDHHWYTPRDVARISALAIEAQADVVVTTEKDEVRFAPVLGSAVPGGTGGPDEAPPSGRVEWAVLPMDVVVEPAPEWARWLAARL